MYFSPFLCLISVSCLLSIVGRYRLGSVLVNQITGTCKLQSSIVGHWSVTGYD